PLFYFHLRVHVETRYAWQGTGAFCKAERTDWSQHRCYHQKQMLYFPKRSGFFTRHTVQSIKIKMTKLAATVLYPSFFLLFLFDTVQVQRMTQRMMQGFRQADRSSLTALPCR
ncbi:unnamed protein product, partial [Ascophyllum nodosum]